MNIGLYINSAGGGKFNLVSKETRQPVTVDMDYDSVVEFLDKMTVIKQHSLKPEEPRLFYNRWND